MSTSSSLLTVDILKKHKLVLLGTLTFMFSVTNFFSEIMGVALAVTDLDGPVLPPSLFLFDNNAPKMLV